MLFDLKTGKRRRVVQVVFGFLAFIFFISFVGFGIGSDVSGGLFDAIGLGGSERRLVDVEPVRAADRRRRGQGRRRPQGREGALGPRLLPLPVGRRRSSTSTRRAGRRPSPRRPGRSGTRRSTPGRTCSRSSPRSSSRRRLGRDPVRLRAAATAGSRRPRTRSTSPARSRPRSSSSKRTRARQNLALLAYFQLADGEIDEGQARPPTRPSRRPRARGASSWRRRSTSWSRRPRRSQKANRAGRRTPPTPGPADGSLQSPFGRPRGTAPDRRSRAPRSLVRPSLTSAPRAVSSAGRAGDS